MSNKTYAEVVAEVDLNEYELLADGEILRVGDQWPCQTSDGWVWRETKEFGSKKPSSCAYRRKRAVAPAPDLLGELRVKRDAIQAQILVLEGAERAKDASDADAVHALAMKLNDRAFRLLAECISAELRARVGKR